MQNDIGPYRPPVKSSIMQSASGDASIVQTRSSASRLANFASTSLIDGKLAPFAAETHKRFRRGSFAHSGLPPPGHDRWSILSSITTPLPLFGLPGQGRPPLGFPCHGSGWRPECACGPRLAQGRTSTAAAQGPGVGDRPCEKMGRDPTCRGTKLQPVEAPA